VQEYNGVPVQFNFPDVPTQSMIFQLNSYNLTRAPADLFDVPESCRPSCSSP
jgi:hypothetical protein